MINPSALFRSPRYRRVRSGETQEVKPADPGVPWLLPFVLSTVAGYVDGCTYLGLFGLFVAQATGSFVLLGLQLITHERDAIAILLAVPAFILAGMSVTLLVSLMKKRPRTALAISLLLEAMLLIGFLLAWLWGHPFGGPDEPGALVALIFAMTAMGAQSATVRLLMRGVPSTNVMTTNSTLFAINVVELALLLRDEDDASQAERRKARTELFMLVLVGFGFFVGVLLGAIAYMTMGLACVLLAVMPVVGAAAWAMYRADVSASA